MKKPTVYFTTSFTILLLFTALFFYILNDYTRNDLAWFDERLITAIQSYVSPSLTSIVNVITFFGSVKWFVLAAIFVCLLLIIAKKYSLAIFVALSSGLGGLINWLLKWLFKRERPDILPLIEETGFSFPSGHSMGSFIFYGALAFVLIHFVKNMLFRCIICLLLGLTILTIGVSRIYLGVHYPSDVLAGFLVGAIWLILNIMVYYYYEYKLKRREVS
ncbi:phosphatase PAP2 family protein [Cytobacillus horneckiae]|uniref:phosphatase PAP2 family protein n=1 Tax=Cytobacillus horneckiae TaxID=549687 RepID=UPI0020411A8C|nr:phosphatase PAP2 family protein [Cytobacillus horneckiae]MCM3177254.1 phosphatase PAP2 family protein [Cytobacillus horneckiae]